MDDQPTLLDHARSLVSGRDGPTGSDAFADLPDDLLAEAMTLVADALPPSVAAHLTPFTTAHSPFADPSASTALTGIDALGTLGRLDPVDLDDPPPLPGIESTEVTATVLDIDSPEHELDIDVQRDKGEPGSSEAEPDELTFGAGDVKTGVGHELTHEQRLDALDENVDSAYLLPAEQRYDDPESELKLEHDDFELVDDPTEPGEWDIDFD